MARAGKPLYKSLYFQVVVAIVIGVLLGHFYPETGTAMERVAGAARGGRGACARQAGQPQTSRDRAGAGALRQGQGGLTP